MDAEELIRQYKVGERHFGRADLNKANLSGANLNGVNLSGANVTDEQLAWAKSLKGATLPDGTIHD